MRWDYGKVFQEIRKSKGLTQEDVCQDFLARSTLARIESGNTIPKFDTMIFLLNQINMSLEEFKYICNSYHPSKRQEILNVAANYNTIVGTQELEKLKIKCQDYLKTHHDVPIEQLLDRLKVAIHIQKFGGYSKDKEFQATTQKIWSYLEKQDTWYESDLRLLSNILFHFSLDTIKEITPKILESIAKYEHFHNIKLPQYQLLTNLATIYLYNNLKNECRDITVITLELAKNLKRYDSLALSQVRLGICRKDDELIHKGMELLRLTEETDLIQTLEEEIKNFR